MGCTAGVPPHHPCSPHTQVPIYDFKESRRVGYRTVEVPASRVVILEGIYALNARLRPMVRRRLSVLLVHACCAGRS